MKRSFNVNIGGVNFCFDEDALELLEKYIARVAEYFKNKGEELKVAETEESIAAKLQARVGIDGIVTIELLKIVLDEIGLPFGAVDCEPQKDEPEPATAEDTDTAEASAQSESSVNSDEAPWRAAMLLGNTLFRDPYDQILGGVLSGVAKYCGWGIALTRVIYLLLFLAASSIGGSGFLLLLVYCVAWGFIPKARGVVDMTRMRKAIVPRYSAEGIETAWKNNYDIAMAELTAPKTNGCLAAFVKIIFFLLVSMVALPILFALGVLLFVLVVILLAVFAAFGGAIFENIYVLILLLLPIFALVHWILKKCGVCRPLNTYIRLAIIVGWFATLVLAGYKIYTTVEENGGWERVQQHIIDKRFLDEDFWKQLVKESLEQAQSESYIAWDDENLPFAIDAKIYRSYDSNDILKIRFIDRDEWYGIGDTENRNFESSSLEVALWNDSVGDIRMVWDSIANELLVSMETTLGSSMSLNSDPDGVQLRYLMQSDSVQYGNAMDYGKMSLLISQFENNYPKLTIYGNDTIEGLNIMPVASRYSLKKNFNVVITENEEEEQEEKSENIEPSDTL